MWFTEKEYDALLAREDNACDPRTVAAFNKVHEMLETAGCLERATLMRVENEKRYLEA